MMSNHDQVQPQQGLLTRLRRDRRGNTLVIVGAALLPMTAMIGSGVDMSRAYLAQSRLQQACDSAALAGRRAITNGVLDTTAKNEALKFFKFNFDIGKAGVTGSAAYGTAPFTPQITLAAETTVNVKAETTIPTAVMSLFGFETLSLKVDCNAKQDFVNTDIVLVLDSTGSMLCATTESSCSNSSEKTTSKIKALRTAVLALYDELKPVQDQLTAHGLRMRYGIVPYSSGVNVGKLLYAENPNHLVSDNWDYQSRRVAKSEAGKWTSSTCDNYPGWNWNDSSKVCTYFVYEKRTLDVSNYIKGNTVDVTPIVGGTSSTSTTARNTTWAGCIEERDTVSTITSTSGYTIPSGANDLNIDLVPSSRATRWRAYWPEVEYLPTSSYSYGGESNKPQWACPTPAKKLQSWTRADLSTYLNSLIATGGTYHDNGMIWGARLISPGGVFGASNPSTYASMPVTRHIIFMTDGLLDTGFDTLYTTYGIEKFDKRVGGTDENAQAARHRQRFKMVCNATKGMNVSIWVVAFASALDTDLTECASNASQASTSSNSTQLTDKFVEIGKNIGSLRLTK